jgi:hypothetical protein
MIFPDLIADFVAPLLPILLQLLAVLDAVGPAGRPGAIGGWLAQPLLDAGALRCGGRRARARVRSAQELRGRTRAGNGAGCVARASCRKCAWPGSAARRTDVQEVLQLAC